MGESRIHILEESVASKIAAGEVVERPASVVKELVENALDAEAGRVEVEVEEAGQRLIRVRDDGWGMTREEAVLALQRHSTSKIERAEDLGSIRTLGFRGEALPSIAAVSHLSLVTRARGSDSGTRLAAEGGVVKELEEVGAPEGTEVAVGRLFYNTPARLKFLRSKTSELAHIVELMAAFSFSHPEVSLRLSHEGREVMNRPGSSQLLPAVAAFLGRQNAEQLVAVELSLPWIAIAGYTSRPELSRATRSQERFFVNRRWVRSRLLSRALEEAYRTVLPGNRYPVAVMRLELAAEQVDVNVHPAKAEVRFLREGEVFQAVRRAASEALDRARLAPSAAISAPGPFPARPETSAGAGAGMTLPAAGSAPGVLSPAFEPAGRGGALVLTPLAQLRATFILADSEQGLLVVDQHRAHERVLFERFSAGREEKRPESQALAIPATVHLGRAEADLLLQHVESLGELGLELEQFGADSFLVRRVPVALAKQDPAGVVRDLVEDLAAASLRGGGPTSLEVRRERARISLACRSAVKAGDALTAEEMGELLAELCRTSRPFTCPHGRPTVMTISNFELERRFHR
jgi:DNA mismatch repair protein MutL